MKKGDENKEKWENCIKKEAKMPQNIYASFYMKAHKCLLKYPEK